MVFAHGISKKEDIAAVVSSVDCPVNVMVGMKRVQSSLRELSDMGVKRVSVGPSLFVAAISAVLRAGQEMREHGTFTFDEESVDFSHIKTIVQA